MKEKTFVFKVNLKNLAIGLISALMIAIGLFLYVSILNGRISFENSPWPRQDRGILIIVAWVLICGSFLVLSPNKNGLIPALSIFLGLYLSFVYTTGSYIIFDASDWIDIAVAAKIIIPPAIFIMIVVVLVYNAVSGQEFFRSVIFGGVVMGFLILGMYTGVL